jgi:hypothetical protein
MVNELSATDSLITFTLSDTLDPAIYNYPLTIRREMPQGWQSFTAAQHDTAINSSIVEINSKKYITFNAVPDSSIITIANNAITGIREDNKSGLKLPELKQNYPNPFSAGGGSAYGGNPSTKISYTIPNESMVVLKIFDVTGKEVTTLVNESRPAGNYEVDFSPKIGSASGVYFYRLQTGNYSNTKKFIMMK